MSLAQDSEPSPPGAWITASGHRQVLFLSPGTAAAESRAGAHPIRARTLETATHRIHVVDYQGETFAALAPVSDPAARIVFDPVRRTFARLLPSIRVETSDAAQVDSIVMALGATGATFFEPLGFAIVQLPPGLEPLDAVARVDALPGQATATVRLPMAPVKWR